MKNKILIVDDNDDNRELLKTMLENTGYEVIDSENGEEALKIIKKKHNEIVIVITDIRMPKMDGKELIKNIRTDFKTMGIIAITLYPNIYHEDDYRKLGADDYIVKPFDLEKIKFKIERLLFQIENLKTKN